MIWFDIKELERKISRNELSEKDGFYYLIAYSIMSVFALSFAANKTNGWMMLSEFAISLLITIWGLNTIYEVNNGIDGKDLLKRFFAITWVIGMRMFIVLIPLAIFIGMFYGIFAVKNNINIHETNPLVGIISITFKSVFTIIYILLTINSFKNLKINK
jgi:hypothetical protein